MDWNNTPNDARLRLWKSLRNDIVLYPISEQLKYVATFFSKMPYGTRTVDYYNPISWPTPWEVLFHGMFCKSSISILMYYTITMINPGCNIELHLINDGEDEYLVPVIDSKFVLNYQLGVVNNYIDVKTEFTNKLLFTAQDIKQIT